MEVSYLLVIVGFLVAADVVASIKLHGKVNVFSQWAKDHEVKCKENSTRWEKEFDQIWSAINTLRRNNGE